MANADPEKRSAWQRAYHAANREKRNAYSRAYKAAHRDHIREACKAYHAANREKRNAQSKAYAATHRDWRNAYSRAYLGAHPERRLLSGARTRAQRYGVPCALTIADVRALLAPMRCSATGLPLAHAKRKAEALSPSIDRIEPARGYVPGNVRLVCRRFNELRGTDPVSQDFRHALRVLAETSCETDRVNLPALTRGAQVPKSDAGRTPRASST